MNRKLKTEKLNPESQIAFGIHKGKKLKDVPCSYLLNLYNKRIAFGALLVYINENLDILNAQNAINNGSGNGLFSRKLYIRK